MVRFCVAKAFSCLNADEAIPHSGKRGWFGDNYEELKRSVLHDEPLFLHGVRSDWQRERFAFIKAGSRSVHAYFYPLEDAKYRPFRTLDEAEEHVGRVMKSKDGCSVRIFDDLLFRNGNLLIMDGLAETVFEEWIFSDGSPVGVVV